MSYFNSNSKNSKPKVRSLLYQFTVKKMSNPYPITTDYEKELDRWRAAGVAVILCKYEIAPEDFRLHLHGIIHIPDSVFRKKLFNKTGWHYQIGHRDTGAPLASEKDCNDWTAYVQKDYKAMGEREYQEMLYCNDIRYQNPLGYPFTIRKGGLGVTPGEALKLPRSEAIARPFTASHLYKWDQHSAKTKHCFTDAEVDQYLDEHRIINASI